MVQGQTNVQFSGRKKDRRRNRRVPTRILSDTSDPTTGTEGLGRIVNLSVGGAFVLTTDTPEPQTEILLRFQLTPSGRTIESPAVVTHVQPGESMGLQFVSLKDTDQKAIAEFVARIAA